MSGGMLDIPPAEGLFEVTLTSNSLYGYLKRLSEELVVQNQLCTKVVDDVAALRTEFNMLSRNSMRMNEEHAANVAKVESALGASVNQAQLRAAATTIQKQVNALAAALEINVYDETDAGDGEIHIGSVKGSDHHAGPEARMTEKHDNGGGRIGSFGNSPTTSPTKHGSRTPAHVSLTPVSLPLAQPSKSTSAPPRPSPTGAGQLQSPSGSPNAATIPTSFNNSQASPGGIRGTIDKCLQDWYKTRGLVDAKIRHEITTSQIKSSMDEMEERLRAEMRAMAETLVSNEYFKESQDGQNAEWLAKISSLSGDVAAQRKLQGEFESQVRSVMISNVRRVTLGAERTNRRISRFYSMMALPEPEDEEDEDDMSLAAEEQLAAAALAAAAGNGPTGVNADGLGGSASSAGTTGVGREGNATTEAQRGPSNYSLPSTRTRSTMSSPQSTKVGNKAPVSDEDGVDVRTSSVIQSPVFVAFRQHVLNDISDRIAASRSTQASDIDIELLAMRNDIRQRVTSTRVVELIKQYTDTDTPARVTSLGRRVAELGDEKVSIPDLNDGLRSKADVHLLDAKASIDYVDRIIKDLREKQAILQSDLSLLISDRREYRDVVQQLLIQQQRMQQSIVGGGTSGHGKSQVGGGLGESLLPAIGDGKRGTATLGGFSSLDVTGGFSAAGGAVDTFEGTLAAGTTPQSRPSVRTPADSSAYAPRPLTEVISPRMSGGAMGGTVIHTPSPPLAMLHKPQIAGHNNSIGLTQSQLGYTQLVSGRSAASSPSSAPAKSGNTSLASVRTDVESKVPLKYSRKDTNTVSGKR